jgi:hypothetical protein
MISGKRAGWLMLILAGIGFVTSTLAVESGQFRLLSTTVSCKLILVSSIPSKNKYILDASSAKITIDGKPGEFQNMQAYAIVQVKYDLKKINKEGIDIDGVATEIKISTPDNRK